MKSVSARLTPTRPTSTAAAFPAAGKKYLKTATTANKNAYTVASARFTEKLMEVQTLRGDDQYLSMISESDNVLCMYLCQRAMEK